MAVNTSDHEPKPSSMKAIKDVGRDIKVLISSALVLLGMGEAGIITANFKGAPNLADSTFRVDRRAEFKLNAEDFPVAGFNAYVSNMENGDSELKGRVFTLNGKKDQEGKYIFKGGDASPLCKYSIFEMDTKINDLNIDITISALGDRLGGLTIKGIPSFASVGIGLFVRGDYNRKIGCDVLVNDGKTDNILVVRYKYDGQIVVDGSPAFSSSLKEKESVK